MPKVSRRKIAQYWVDNYFADRDTTKQVAAYLIDTGRTRELELVVRDIEELLLERGIAVATIRSAKPLTASIRKQLESFIKDASSADQVTLRERVDEELLGGVRIELADSGLDATLRQRLNNIKQRV